MTTMDTDSESQDSDDGRRFRFEATRKDANVRTSSNRRTDTRTFEEKSHHTSHTNEDNHKDRKDRCQNNSGRREHIGSGDQDYERDLKYSTKHSRESKSWKNEDSKNLRDTKNSGPTASKHKSRESRHHRDRDRSDHRKRRSSEERSRDRNQNGRSSLDRHKNKSYDKHRHRDRSRDRTHQSEKAKLSDYNKPRSEQERKDSHKKSSKRETDSQASRDHLSLKSIKQKEDNHETIQSEQNSETNTKPDNQLYKDVNLSEYDVISETDENLSDSSDPQDHKKFRKRDSKIEHNTERTIRGNEDSEECHKVNVRKNDSISGSSNNNPSVVSDSLLGSTSPLISALAEGDQGKFESEEGRNNASNRDDSSCSVDNFILESEDKGIESISESKTYGPVLPPQLSTTIQDEPKKSERTAFIGPCLPQKTVHSDDAEMNSDFEDTQNSTVNIDYASTQGNADDSTTEDDAAFGPALPPHLKQTRYPSEGEQKTIQPSIAEPIEDASDDDDDDNSDAFGPLPPDHPTFKNSHVHMQLEERAMQIKIDRTRQEDNAEKQREEWMTELPPAQATNLGLGPRKFRVRAAPDMSDRSCWTDTPAQKAEKLKKLATKAEQEFHITPSRATEESTEVEAEKSKKRQKSLLELHQKKLKKKKKKEEKEAKLTGQKQRRPFDRDIDLKVNQFDQAQKKSILMKAKLLDDRFSRGQL